MKHAGRWTLAALVLIGLLFAPGCRDDDDMEAAGVGLLDGLARPQPGRSMRATSTMRVGELRRGPDGNRDAGERRYDPTRGPEGRRRRQEQLGQLQRPAGRDPRADGRKGARRHHAHLDHLPRARAAGLGAAGLGQPPGDAAPDLLGRRRPGRRSKRRSAISSPTASAERSEVISLPVVVEDADSYNCFWHMPFRKSARIEIVNQSDKPISLLYYNIDWIKKDRLPDDTPYFYAQYRQEYPVRKGEDYVLLETKGKGHLRRHGARRPDAQPGLVRRGRREDLHRRRSEALDLGHGHRGLLPVGLGPEDDRARRTSACRIFDQWGIVGGHTSAYRWHVHDPIVFKTGIKVTMEHFGWISAGRESRTTRPRAGTSARTTTPAWRSGTRPGAPTFTDRGPRERTHDACPAWPGPRCARGTPAWRGGTESAK